MPNIVGARISLNYGFNAVRFISPVRVDSRIRGLFTLKNLSERKPGNWLATTLVSVEVENSHSPALNAE
jgi:acyl dehydratase